jgi:hypothetical protein
MNFPVEICGIMYEVKETESIYDGLFGSCDYAKGKILLSEGLQQDRKFETFAHELVHALLFESQYPAMAEGSPHTEEFVERFSKVLYQTIIDNDFEEIKREFLGGE